MSNCPTCGHPTPDGNFCVRCGAPLDRQLQRSRQRVNFAAAPGQRKYVPWLVSSLFPQLPRHSERHFRMALATGLAIVIVLGAFRLFPIALISAALLMPLLTSLYLHDVNVYDTDSPATYGLTVVWGAAAGIGLGFLTRATVSTGSSLIDRGSSSHVVLDGVVIPAVGLLITIAGLLALLRRRRFDDVLDGTTFGAVIAASLGAAQAVVVGVGVLGGGLRPAGAAVPWIVRLLAVAIATPTLWMSAASLVGAALWLRYRLPTQERDALGVLGVPIVAVLVALILVVAGAVAETFLRTGEWLAWLVALDLVALILLRRTLHVGLLEEAAEREIGPPLRCANCDALTATHTFCGNCGIALKALPKPRPSGDDTTAPARGSFTGTLAAERRGRRSNHRRRLATLLGVASVLAAASAAGALAAPGSVPARCRRARPCGIPPSGPVVPPRYETWRSSALRFSLRYNDHQWSVEEHGPAQVTLEPQGDHLGQLKVLGASASSATPQVLLAQRVQTLQGELLGLASDPSPSDQLLGPNVGFRPGHGAVYTATTTSPQGPQDPVAIAIVAAGNRRVSVVVTIIAAADDIAERASLYQSADDIINSIRWPRA